MYSLLYWNFHPNFKKLWAFDIDISLHYSQNTACVVIIYSTSSRYSACCDLCINLVATNINYWLIIKVGRCALLHYIEKHRKSDFQLHYKKCKFVNCKNTALHNTIMQYPHEVIMNWDCKIKTININSLIHHITT